MSVQAQVNCAAKRYFSDKKAAVTALKLALKKRDRHGRAEKLRAYHCRCGGWHFTKQV